MRRRGNIFFIGLLVLVLVGALVAAFFARQYSVVTIGEEGYEDYDPRLSTNSFDPAKWLYEPTGESCRPKYGVGGEYVCIRPYDGVTAKNGELSVTPVGGEQVFGYLDSGGDYSHAVRTQDLRLVDFKTSFRVDTGSQAGTCLWTNKRVVWCYTQARSSSPKTSTAGIELRWDDYELGHYQVFVNGASTPVQEGTIAESESLFFYTRPYVPYGNNFGTASGSFINPRVRRLFGCDLQAGEVKVHTCTSGPAVVSLSDLKGFVRFCPSLPATFTDAGISAASKRVYYSLAQDKPVVIQANQAWEFQYLATSKSMNTPPDKTGLVELCKGPIIIEDLKDLPVENPKLQDGTLSWTSYGRFDGTAGYKNKKTDLQSGNQAFMKTSVIKIDEQACPYKEETQSYPGMPRDCFSVEAFGETFHDGDTLTVTPHFNVTLENLAVRYRLDETNGKVFTWSARWKLDFGLLAVTVEMPVADAVQGSSYGAQYKLLSELPSPGFYVTGLEIYSKTIGEKTTITSDATLTGTGTQKISVQLPTTTLGEQTVTLRPSLQTEYGAISFSQAIARYNVTTQQNSNTSSLQTEEGSWWSSLWEWIKSLFQC